MTHTPGPWEIIDQTEMDEGLRTLEDQFTISPPLGEVGPIAIVSGKDDANLIATAPELLEALEAMIKEVDESGIIHRPVQFYVGEIERAKSAIAKAKGGKS